MEENQKCDSANIHHCLAVQTPMVFPNSCKGQESTFFRVFRLFPVPFAITAHSWRRPLQKMLPKLGCSRRISHDLGLDWERIIRYSGPCKRASTKSPVVRTGSLRSLVGSRLSYPWPSQERTAEGDRLRHRPPLESTTLISYDRRRPYRTSRAGRRPCSAATSSRDR